MGTETVGAEVTAPPPPPLGPAQGVPAGPARQAVRGRYAAGGAAYVLLGLAVQAVTTYLVLILAGRILGAAEFGGLAALYVFVSALATGLFQALEQEVARRRGSERETGRTDPTLVYRVALFGVCLSAVVVGLALAVQPAMVRMLGQHPQLLAAFCAALPGYALCFVARGALSGRDRLVRYGAQLAVEGVFRIVGLGVLVALDVRSAGAYGWLFGAASWVAFGASVAGLRHSGGGRRGTAAAALRPSAAGTAGPANIAGRLAGVWRSVAASAAPLLLLLVSGLAAQLLIGAGPIVASLFVQPDERAQAGAFFAALVVVRMPVFLFTAVQPSLLPAMAAHVAAGRRRAFISVLLMVLGGMGLVALAATAGVTLLGSWGLRLLFGAGYRLSQDIFLLMGLSVGLYLVAVVLSQAILALGKHRFVLAGWLAGVVGLGVGVAAVQDTILRATLSLLIGAAAATLTFWLLLAYRLRRWPHPADGQPPA